eukprot:352736-Chlamydomonas_euryale.AAC.1
MTSRAVEPARKGQTEGTPSARCVVLPGAPDNTVAPGCSGLPGRGSPADVHARTCGRRQRDRCP